MNAAKQALWLFLSLIGLAGSGWYFASIPAPTQLDETTLSQTADFMVQNLSVRQFNQAGSVAKYLESPEMHHIPYEDTHFFQNPHIIVRQEDNSQWDIRSHTAKSLHQAQQIVFNHNVVLQQSKPNNLDFSLFKTEELTYLSKQQYAYTHLPVSFVQNGTVIHSTGMQAYLAEKHVVLLNKAQAIYTPKQA